jgi:endonuclease/exonuclease/phosphatase family metal-dependent hydrolase
MLATLGATTADEITVACWNVENLFDSRKDTELEGEPVPNAEQVKLKMSKLAEVIKHLKADVVGLIEVEHAELLRTLTRDQLAGEGYDYFCLIEQTDPRGIDVGLISKIPFAAYSFDVPSHTRGVLACRLAVRGEPFYVLVNHWKSRIGGGAEVRMACARRTIELAGDLLPRYEGRKVPTLVVGDLNDDDTDDSVRALEKSGLSNVLKRLRPAERWSYPWWDSMNKQVHYHSFDHIFANEAMADGAGIDLVPNSARVVRPKFMQRKRRIEGRDYDWIDDSYGQHIGYSDHFPVAVTLRVP